MNARVNPLANLSGRERALILLALPLVLLLGGYRFAWVPLGEARAARTAEIAAYRLVAAAAASAVALDTAAGARPAEAPADPAPFAARVTASAEAAGLSLSRLEPEGQSLRVVVAEAGFAPLVLWIADLEAGQGVVLTAIELDRRTAPGAVSARLLLEPAQGPPL